MTDCTPEQAIQVAERLGLHPLGEARRLLGGADLAAFQIACAGGAAVALRVAGPERAQSFIREAAVMHAARSAGIPVPAVLATGRAQTFSAMAMEFVPGVTLFEYIKKHPASASRLGYLFGKLQAQLHAAPENDVPESSWATPQSAVEAQLLRVARGTSAKVSLLHLDFHPMNALTDGRHITGIIDWTNAGTGDPRQDIARTAAILRIEAPREARASIRRFLRGWHHGYLETAGAIPRLAPFLAWAGARMERDLEMRADALHQMRIRNWTALWQVAAGQVGVF
ncbi:MAG: aminoglycoside phosphotransferase family protein [Thermaerobacter sp.]|nr:aminoglycoside phosphotransferase family protein [Thermaerobacter sp.]